MILWELSFALGSQSFIYCTFYRVIQLIHIQVSIDLRTLIYIDERSFTCVEYFGQVLIDFALLC